ncbi:serine/threonine-protein kinase [Nocardia yamanashiensis]|uniref:serine/threonine-protein kinase n=1 Tax=Nocardia yamanashiensis TaxID=209247 RepID=UPI000832478B|nr:serine/threonine-protein kinase [Nocardia yamanashiensis]
MGRTLERGQVFAGYLVERLLGVGGMGEVYLARDRDLPRPVALKLLAPGKSDDPEVRARFLREADTAARLSHPNIVAVYARGNDDHRLWMAMQYIEGTDVAEVLAQGPLRPEHAVRILGETARALDHAHRAGVLHRDVKPANILLAWGPEQRVFLADFGIAKALDQTGALTRTGEMYASFQYASPEQFELRADLDQRADVYALGCTLFHMLTGELPFPGQTTAQLVAGHLHGEIPHPSVRRPGVPTAFDQVIARALAKQPGDRYGSCGELAAAAEQALGTPVHTGSPWQDLGPRPAFAPLPVYGSGATTRPQDAPAPVTTGPRRTPVTTTGPGHLPQPGPTTQAGIATQLGYPTQPETPPTRRGRKRLVLAGLIVAAVLAGGIGVGFGSGALRFTFTGGAPGLSATDPSRDAAIKAACDYGLLMTTYDYNDGDGWQTKVVAGATGTWKTQSQQLLPAIRLLLEADSEHSRGTDAKCVITSGNTTHYELTADITVVNSTKGKADTTEQQNITMSMDYVDGKWLCGKWSSPLFPT